MNTQNSSIVSEDLKKQREFLEKIKNENFDFGIVVGKAFVRGMRDLGYKNNGTILDELVDNSIQSEATRVDIVFGYEKSNSSMKRPDYVAVVDDGHGMDPVMIRVAAMWGGTHRENDRTGFGRYGYGLPSACVGLARRFTIISRVEGGEYYGVTVDVDDISEGMYSDATGKIVIPEAKKMKVPSWITEYISKNHKNDTHGTIILLEKLDRLDPKTTKNFKEFLLQHFGIVYRNFLRSFKIYVDYKDVEPIDPLFITPGFRFYDEDDDQAIPLPELYIDIKDKDTKEVKGTIKARFSVMPPTFLRVSEHKQQERGTNNNRFKIRREHNGIIVLRAGRQIDLASKNPWTTFQNNDRYIGIEIDFPPILDEEFSITTSKQQVGLSERIWDLLEEGGVYNVIKKSRDEYDKLSTEFKRNLQEKGQEEESKRMSELAMEEVKKFDTRPESTNIETQKQGEKNLDEEVKKISKKTGKDEKEVKEELEFELKDRPYLLEEEDMPGAPFYRVEQFGGQKKLFLNKGHRFYKDIYMSPDSTPRLRYGLEVLLFVMGDCELSAEGDRKLFYQTERQEWSKWLNIALDRLSKWNNDMDAESSKEENEQALLLESERKQ
jgi:hypothetical protein